MKKLVLLILMLAPLLGFGQTKYFKNAVFSGNIDFTGTYTGNVIDLSNITIDYTGSSGPAPFRIGTYSSPLMNADEDQSGMLRLYGQTSANGTSYDRGIFVALKTTGTKGIYPIAGLAEILGQAGTGPTSATAGQFIADLHETDAVLAATTGGGEGMHGAWFKVTAIDGATTNANSIVAPIWVDNQLYGNNAATTNKEYGIRATTGGTKPKAFVGFATTSVGYDQLLYFDVTAYDQAPVSNTTLKTMLNTTQYYIPLSTADDSFTWGYPITLNGSSTYGLNLSGGTYSTADFIGQNSAIINNSDANTLSVSVNSVEAARFVEATTTQLLVGDGTEALPSFSFISDPDNLFYLSGTNQMGISFAGSGRYIMDQTDFKPIGKGGSWYLKRVTASDVIPVFTFIDDDDTGEGHAGADLLSHIAGGKEGIRIDGLLGGVEVIIKDTITIEALATADVEVLSPDANGVVISRPTADGSEITWDTMSVNFVDVTNDLDVGDTIEFDNGLQIYNTHADTGYIKETVIKIDGVLHAFGDLKVKTNIVMLASTSSAAGVIYKGANPFIHDFTLAGTNGYNTFIGINAGNFTMTGSTGVEGSTNTAIGYNSLTDNTTGYNNTATGYHSLHTNTTGLNNTAYGYTALGVNLGGHSNTAIGKDVLDANTSGHSNTGVGSSTLTSNDDGYSNTAIGRNALLSNEGGFYNSANGENSLSSNIDGARNVGFGSYSLGRNTSGSYNTGLGMEAGMMITGGTDPNETSSYGVYVGYATLAGASGNTNEIVIGASTTGNGSNTVTLGNSSILETYLAGDVMIDDLFISDTVEFDNGAYISNEETDTIKITETVTKIEGNLVVTGNLEVAGTESKYADMYLNTNGNPTTMETANSPIGVIFFTTGDQNGFTFNAGGTGAITAYADFGVAAGDTVTVTDNGHGLADGDFIVIRGTTNYNGVWEIGYIGVNSFYIVDTWVADDGASDWEEPSYLQLTAGANESFDVQWHISAQKAGGASATVAWCVYRNTNPLPKTIQPREIPGTDIGSISGGGLEISVSAGDRFFMVIESDNTNDITNMNGTLILIQE